jgi:hypothetical protein
LGFLGIESALYRATGLVDFSGSLSLGGVESEAVNLRGLADFGGWEVSCKEKVLLQNLFAKAVFDSNQLRIEGIRADMCQGIFESSLAAKDWFRKDDFSLEGRLSGKQLDLSQLSKCLELPAKLSKGVLRFEYGFTGDAQALKSLSGEGIVFVDDSDLYRVPVINQVFTFVGLKESDFQRATDAMIAFMNEGPVLTVAKAQAANRFWAIRFEPGGTVDIQNKTVDLHVVVIPLSGVEDIVRRLPFAELFGRLKDKLIRLKVQGKWTEPASKLISKEPLTDVKEATVNFIRDAVESGGQITEKMRKPFRELMNKRESRKKE